MSPNAAAGQTRQSEGAQATVAHRLPHPFDPHAWLDLKCMVGAGAYGRVYMAGDTAGRRFAVKQLNKTPAARREISLHQRCNGHPNVVGMFGSHEDHLGLWMILEYCPDGDLFHHITHADGIFHSDRSANEPTIKLAFSQVCDGIAWCHQRGVYHRDIKPENVLVWLERDPMTGYIRPVLKIADFGLATERPYTHDFGCGSTFYMSPECIGFAGNPPPAYGSGPTDVWSLGILLLNIVTAQNPWRQAHPREEAFVYYQRDPHNFLARLLPITDALQRCVCRALELSVRHRCTVQELRSAVLDCDMLRRPRCYTAPPPAETPRKAAAAETRPETAARTEQDDVMQTRSSCYAEPSQQGACWNGQFGEQGDSGFESGKPASDEGANSSCPEQSIDYNDNVPTGRCYAVDEIAYMNTPAAATSDSFMDEDGPEMAYAFVRPSKQMPASRRSPALAACTGTVKAADSAFVFNAPYPSCIYDESLAFCSTQTLASGKRRGHLRRQRTPSFWMFDAVRDLFIRRQRC